MSRTGRNLTTAFEGRLTVNLVHRFYTWNHHQPFPEIIAVATSVEATRDGSFAKAVKHADGDIFVVGNSAGSIAGLA